AKSSVTMPPARGVAHWATRHGERSCQVLRTPVAQAVVLSLWHRLQAFGIFNASLSDGEIKRKVWARTFTSAMVCSIFGMWQAMHSLPALPSLWCVWASMVGAWG